VISGPESESTHRMARGKMPKGSLHQIIQRKAYGDMTTNGCMFKRKQGVFEGSEYYDIALGWVGPDFKYSNEFGRNVGPICVPSGKKSHDLQSGIATISGFKWDGPSGHAPPFLLQDNLTLIQKQKCKTKDHLNFQTHRESIFCATWTSQLIGTGLCPVSIFFTMEHHIKII